METKVIKNSLKSIIHSRLVRRVIKCFMHAF